ncbi:hypothetical protein GDO78_017995 [Eleutherodactylus coqui]|uniref:Ig-like domain-containing protein n=1 Tax=Eleutherodactylus coqui TaxID=57060 RepID=A0A8J6BES9_ELECQ|nr:hypothetical protein GDO78_017995 [Eleutherodactylus coqui]
MEDDGYQYSCVVNHRSLRQDLRKDFTLTVTERENTSARVTAAVICTFVAAALLFAAGAVSYQAFKKDPPTMSEITGNDQLIDMTRTTLTCCILNYKRKDLEISVTLKRHGVEMIIGTLRLGDHHVSSDEGNDGGGSVERQSLMNRDVSPTEGPLQLTIKPNVTKIKPRLLRCVPWRRLSSYNCQCSLHITPSFSEDDGAELSVHVTHSTLVKPDPKNKTTLKDPVSKKKTLRVVGVPPTLLKIVSPAYVRHGELTTLTCPIIGFKPRSLQITWLRTDRDGCETEVLTWESDKGSDRKSENHKVIENENEDHSYSFQSALTMRPRVAEDGVQYTCRTFHRATGQWAEQALNMAVTGERDKGYKAITGERYGGT